MHDIVKGTHSKAERQLPSEVFSIIFQYACPTPDIFTNEPIHMPTFHLVLRLVSKLWHNIVQSTPQLWTSAILLNLIDENFHTKGQFLKLCLDNSGVLPLTFSFEYDEEPKNVAGFISPIVDATLVHNIHRIQALRIIQPPRSWLGIFNLEMDELTTLYIEKPRLKLVTLPLYECDTCFSLLTHVDLAKVPIDFAIGTLLRCPNLIDFACLDPLTAQIENPRTLLASPFVLSHLSTFTWTTTLIEGNISDWDVALFEHINFPALKRFNWWFGKGLTLTQANTTFRQPLSRFPKSLTIIQLGGVMTHTVVDLLGFQMFCPLSNVHQLRFMYCSTYFVEDAFYELSQKEFRDDFLFPNLTSIMLDYRTRERWREPWTEFPCSSGDEIVRMLQNRAGLINEFIATVDSAYLTTGWSREVWRTLIDFKVNGLKLTIIEDGTPVAL